MDNVTRTGNHSANRTGATVSRRLHASHFNISPAARRHRHYGIFVTATDSYVSVLVDTGLDDRNEQTAHAVRGTVAAWAQVTGAKVTEDDGVFWVRFTYKTA